MPFGALFICLLYITHYTCLDIRIDEFLNLHFLNSYKYLKYLNKNILFIILKPLPNNGLY